MFIPLQHPEVAIILPARILDPRQTTLTIHLAEAPVRLVLGRFPDLLHQVAVAGVVQDLQAEEEDASKTFNKENTMKHPCLNLCHKPKKDCMGVTSYL